MELVLSGSGYVHATTMKHVRCPTVHHCPSCSGILILRPLFASAHGLMRLVLLRLLLHTAMTLCLIPLVSQTVIPSPSVHLLASSSRFSRQRIRLPLTAQRARLLPIFRVDFEEVIDDYHHHCCAAEKDREAVEGCVCDHCSWFTWRVFGIGICGCTCDLSVGKLCCMASQCLHPFVRSGEDYGLRADKTIDVIAERLWRAVQFPQVDLSFAWS